MNPKNYDKKLIEELKIEIEKLKYNISTSKNTNETLRYIERLNYEVFRLQKLENMT